MILKKKLFFLMAAIALLCGCQSQTEVGEETIPTTVPVAVVTETTVPPTEETVPPTTVPTEPPEEHFVLTFVGDCTLGSDPAFYYAPSGFIQTVGEDYDYPFRNVVEYFENDDFTMINLEGVFTDKGAPANKTFTFRAPPDYIRILTQNSVEAVTLANNHTLDYHMPGYTSTKELLEEAAIPYVEQNSSTLFTIESGLTIGLYAATFMVDMEDLKTEVAALREQGAEIVIFAVHWGNEGVYKPYDHHVQQAYDAIDAGVDIVYGHHPHVLQRMEKYNDGVIFFSLGNFSFGGHLEPPDLDTAIMQQEIIRDAQGNITQGELTVIPASISSIPVRNNFQPTPYEPGSEDYQRVLDKLSGEWKGNNLSVNY